jgi:hypothetical protein
MGQFDLAIIPMNTHLIYMSKLKRPNRINLKIHEISYKKYIKNIG